MNHPADAEYVPGLSWSLPLPQPRPIESLLRDAYERWPLHSAIDFYDMRLSYADLYRLAARAAAGLQALGVGPGVSVGLLLPNTPHYVVCFFGVLLAGGYVINMSTAAAERQVREQVLHAKPEVLITITTPAIYAKARAIADEGLVRRLVMCASEDFQNATVLSPQNTLGGISFSTLIDNDGEFSQRSRDTLDVDVALIQYTGGTTGEPKGAVLTHANCSNLVSMANDIARISPHEERRLVTVPFSHIFGVAAVMLGSIARGSELVLHSVFEAGAVLDAIERKRISAFAGVPATYAALLGHPRFELTDLTSLNGLYCGGAPLPPSIRAAIESRTGLRVLDGYGLTETMGFTTNQALARRHVPGSVGIAFPNTTVEIVDLETGLSMLPTGQIGEVCVSGPQVFSGYWNNDAANEYAFRGGRFHTGDIGRLDDFGHLTLVDRKKDILFCAGFNVFPRIVEQCIEEHPLVMEAAVIGVPDRLRGHRVKAFVTLHVTSEQLSLAELRLFLSNKLAIHELPALLEIRSQLPKTPVGKLWKQPLIDSEASSA